MHRRRHCLCEMALFHTPNFLTTLPLHFNIAFERHTVGRELKCLKCDKFFHLLTIYCLVPNDLLYPSCPKHKRLSFAIFLWVHPDRILVAPHLKVLMTLIRLEPVYLKAKFNHIFREYFYPNLKIIALAHEMFLRKRQIKSLPRLGFWICMS